MLAARQLFQAKIEIHLKFFLNWRKEIDVQLACWISQWDELAFSLFISSQHPQHSTHLKSATQADFYEKAESDLLDLNLAKSKTESKTQPKSRREVVDDLPFVVGA